MEKRTITWSRSAVFDLLEIMDFYNHQNKSKTYSLQLQKVIKNHLQTIDFSVALPQKTTDEKLYYLTINHIVVCFEINENDIDVQLLIDDRRNPQTIKRFVRSL